MDATNGAAASVVAAAETDTNAEIATPAHAANEAAAVDTDTDRRVAAPQPKQPPTQIVVGAISGADAPTKARLFTLAEDGEWTEIGLGYASVHIEDDDADDAATEPLGRLDIITLDDSETLMSVPLVAKDIYSTQRSTILVWTEPELSRDMAASFSTTAGLDAICGAIAEFQRRLRRWQLRREGGGSGAGGSGAAAAEQLQAAEGVQASDLSAGTIAAAESSNLAAEASDDASARQQQSPWAVCRENLPALVRALDDNKYRLSVYIKQNRQTFFRELADLFHRARDEQQSGGADRVAVTHIGRIVYGLLSPPFNTENQILGMLVDEGAVDDTIDIVQCYLGRVDAATGFVTPPQRRAGFRNPSRLPPRYVQQVHFLFALQYLRDLLPLLLDDGGEGVGVSGLAIYMLKLRYALLHDVAADSDFLPQTFAATPFAPPSPFGAAPLGGAANQPAADSDRTPQAPPENGSVDSAELVSFLAELSTSAKNSPLPLEAKEELFRCLSDRGTLVFLSRVFVRCVFGRGGGALDDGTDSAARRHQQLVRPMTAKADGIAEKDRWVTAARCADIVGHIATFAPNAARQCLLRDARDLGSRQSDVAKTIDHPAPTADANESGGDATPPERPPNAARRESNAEDDSSQTTITLPLLRALPLALFHAPDNSFSQTINDAVLALGVGLVHSNAPLPINGPETTAMRVGVLRYWADGAISTQLLTRSIPPPGAASPAASVALFGCAVPAGASSRSDDDWSCAPGHAPTLTVLAEEIAAFADRAAPRRSARLTGTLRLSSITDGADWTPQRDLGTSRLTASAPATTGDMPTPGCDPSRLTAASERSALAAGRCLLSLLREQALQQSLGDICAASRVLPAIAKLLRGVPHPLLLGGSAGTLYSSEAASSSPGLFNSASPRMSAIIASRRSGAGSTLPICGDDMQSTCAAIVGALAAPNDAAVNALLLSSGALAAVVERLAQATSGRARGCHNLHTSALRTALLAVRLAVADARQRLRDHRRPAMNMFLSSMRRTSALGGGGLGGSFAFGGGAQADAMSKMPPPPDLSLVRFLVVPSASDDGVPLAAGVDPQQQDAGLPRDPTASAAAAVDNNVVAAAEELQHAAPSDAARLLKACDPVLHESLAAALRLGDDDDDASTTTSVAVSHTSAAGSAAALEAEFVTMLADFEGKGAVRIASATPAPDNDENVAPGSSSPGFARQSSFSGKRPRSGDAGDDDGFDSAPASPSASPADALHGAPSPPLSALPCPGVPSLPQQSLAAIATIATLDKRDDDDDDDDDVAPVFKKARSESSGDTTHTYT